MKRGIPGVNIWCSLICVTKRNVEKLCKVIEFYSCFGESSTIHTGFWAMPPWLFMQLFGRGRVKIKRKCVETRAIENICVFVFFFSKHWEGVSRPYICVKMERDFQQKCLLSFSYLHALFHFWFSCSAWLLPVVSPSAADGFPQLWFGVSG